MPCGEWHILVGAYRRAVAAYGDAVVRLSLCSESTLTEAWQCAEQARAIVERSRSDLLHHELEHGEACQEGAAVSVSRRPVQNHNRKVKFQKSA
jgi:hypothetical protein